MKIIIYQNREVYKENSKIGNDSENKVETLEFEFPEEYKDFTKYIEFQIKGEKYVDLIENNKYVITKSVAKYGKIKAQVVLKKNSSNDTEIFKSDMFTLTVSNSINATESLVNEVSIDFIEKLVSKNNEQDSRLNTLETDNTTNSESLSNLKIDNETNKTDILNLKQDQIMLNTNISNLKKDNISNKAKIESLELKDTEQDTNIQKNTESIDSINKKDTEQDKEIEELKTKDINQDNLIEELQEENKELKLENSLIKEQIPNGNIVGNSIHIKDSSNLEMSLKIKGGHMQETNVNSPSPDYPSEIETLNDSVTVEILNKNTLNIGTIEKYEHNGLEVSTEIDKVYVKGTTLNDDHLFVNVGEKDRFILLRKFKPGTYTFSIKVTGVLTKKIAFYLWNVEGKISALVNVSTENEKNEVTFTLEEEQEIYLSCWTLKDIVLDNCYFLQIEQSSTATDYTPHQSQKVTIPIQQEMLEGDYIDEIEHHEWGKIENYNGETVKTDYISTTGELTTGATVYYKLAEPLDLELTSEQKKIMEQKLYTYKNITNIDIDSELASLDVTYKKDIETYEKRISALESVALGGE